MITAITKRVERFGPILVYPGEDEMLALAEGAVRVLVGRIVFENINNWEIHAKERVCGSPLLFILQWVK
jgi:butyrate kinase